MTGLLSAIHVQAALGSVLLSMPGQLKRDGESYPVKISRQRSQRPLRAMQTGGAFDAQYRIDRSTAGAEPAQNDTLEADGVAWIVWRLAISPAGSHWLADVMSPPETPVTPVTSTRTSDGAGGWVTTEGVPDSAGQFLAKVRSAEADQALTAQTTETLRRVAIYYRAADASLSSGDALDVDGERYTVAAVHTEDANPAWRRAYLQGSA